MNHKLLEIGSYMPGADGAEAVIDREYYRQGFIVKNEAAFLHHPEQVCYVPELSDAAYTRQDFLSLCNGQEAFARECFYAVDWQHPETWVDEQFILDEWELCPHCHQLYDMAGERCPCPICGASPDEEGEQNANTESERRPAESGGL